MLWIYLQGVRKRSQVRPINVNLGETFPSYDYVAMVTVKLVSRQFTM